ncbi:MAG: DUF3048 domain-containing protein [Lachnospiraceae bacterium]|nr:DUF3048 domain-containing protein [Lachnospiraceae bacterium]
MNALKKTRIWTYSVIAFFFIVAFGIIVYAYTGTGEDTVASTGDKTDTAEPTMTPTPTPTQSPDSRKEDKAEEDTGEKDDGLKEGQMRSYLSGLPVKEEIAQRRPIAVMLNNLKAAQPMCSVSRADVVYEYVVEGAITRLMALFDEYEDLDKIGSVRSCREYFVYTALEFDAIYCHYGQAAYAVDLLNSDYVDNLNGLGKEGDIVYYRTSDRKAPHNAYTSAAGIDAGIEMLGFRRNHYEDFQRKFKFCDLGDTVTNENGLEVTHMEPNYRINKPWFDYDPDREQYGRYQYDGPQIDELTGEQLFYDNVIFQYNKWAQLDEKDYLAFDCHSGGVIQYFTKGKMVVGTWKREGQLAHDGNYDLCPIRYYDLQGNEITINNGKTFICVIQDTAIQDIVIE